MNERDKKMLALGYSPECNLKAGAIYKPVVIDGTTAYVSGCVPFDDNQVLTSKGKVPNEVPLEAAKKAAQQCAVNILRLLRRELGSLDRIDRVCPCTWIELGSLCNVARIDHDSCYAWIGRGGCHD